MLHQTRRLSAALAGGAAALAALVSAALGRVPLDPRVAAALLPRPPGVRRSGRPTT